MWLPNRVKNLHDLSVPKPDELTAWLIKIGGRGRRLLRQHGDHVACLINRKRNKSTSKNRSTPGWPQTEHLSIWRALMWAMRKDLTSNPNGHSGSLNEDVVIKAHDHALAKSPLSTAATYCTLCCTLYDAERAMLESYTWGD